MERKRKSGEVHLQDDGGRRDSDIDDDDNIYLLSA